MKAINTIALIILTLFSVIDLFAQNDSCTFRTDSIRNKRIYTTVETSPTIGKSEKETFEYIGKHFNYPYHYCGDELLIASFIVLEDGTTEQIQLIKKSEFEPVNQNFLSLLESMPKWNPGYCNGKPVNTEVKLPLRLKLK